MCESNSSEQLQVSAQLSLQVRVTLPQHPCRLSLLGNPAWSILQHHWRLGENALRKVGNLPLLKNATLANTLGVSICLQCRAPKGF